MNKKWIIVYLVWALCFLTGTAQTFSFDFSEGDQMFLGGVSDFGVNQSDQHQFQFENQPLPSPLPSNQNAQYVSGVNPSDDLFIYLKRKVTGLQPFTTYLATFIVEFASIYPTNAVGVGGAPGEGVTMKAGLTLVEPDTMIIQKGGPFVIMNIDKGNQSMPGPDMDTIGHVGVSDTTTVYALKTNDNLDKPFTFITDANGEAWLIVGTDSGFESTTSIYYTHITLGLEIISSNDNVTDLFDIRIYPNPSLGDLYIQSGDNTINQIRIFDTWGNLIYREQCQDQQRIIHLSSGVYFVQIRTDEGFVVRKVVII
jgi:Secretion system C-terminal sorting domain